jgi:hypothetical protein
MNQLREYRAAQAARHANAQRQRLAAAANAQRTREIADAFKQYTEMHRNLARMSGRVPVTSRVVKSVRVRGLGEPGRLTPRRVDASRKTLGQQGALAATLAPVFQTALLPQARRSALFRAANARAANAGMAMALKLPSVPGSAGGAKRKRGGSNRGGTAAKKRTPPTRRSPRRSSPRAATPTPAIRRRLSRSGSNSGSNIGSNSGSNSNGNNGNFRVRASPMAF